MLYFLFTLLFLSAFTENGKSLDNPQKIATGHLPVVATDAKGIVHLAYGQDSTIYYAVANKQSIQFNNPVMVATLPQLVAGAKRGPQIAVTEQYVVITAVNRTGNVFAYSLDRQSGKWSPAVRINDVPEVAKEGFQAVAGASKGTFHTTWLDLRENKRNKIAMATSRDGGRTWSANRVVYRSPDATVCECCKVSIAAKQNEVYIQFRNWLHGSRDLYLAHSTDNGETFAPAQKMGTGTWKLNACPMDGGSVILSATNSSKPNQPLTVWRRENTLYTCRPGESEQAVSTGRNVTAASSSSGTALAWDEAGMVWLKLNGNEPISLGKGQIPSVALTSKSAVCVWEAEGQVLMNYISLN